MCACVAVCVSVCDIIIITSRFWLPLVQLIYAPLRRQRVVNFWSLRGTRTHTDIGTDSHTHTDAQADTYAHALIYNHNNN